MTNGNDIIHLLADAFGLPIIDGKNHVWFFRTESGLYYYDFRFNNYIALGWDLIAPNLINDIQKDIDKKKSEISILYPDEKRPGLILGQMETFYNKMQKGDIIVIPSVGGKEVSIGVLGEIAVSITHTLSDNEYPICVYKHKRTVSWLKRVDLWTDVYFSKVLRAQQTISDITEYAEMVYRNLHPCYISSKAIHLTMRKTTDTDYNITDNIMLQSSVIQISKLLSEYFEIPIEQNSIKIKTAVGSPGFLELIFPVLPVSAIAVACVFNAFVGKFKNEKGEMASGIMAIISKGNDLLNDHVNRQKTKAEIEQIKANTRKTEAETAKIHDELSTQNSREMLLVEISDHCSEIKNAADNSGIKIENQLKKIC